MTPDGLLDLVLGSGGALAILAFFVILIIRGDLVPRSHHERIVALMEDFRAIALRSTTNTGRALDTAQRLAPPPGLPAETYGPPERG